MNKHGTFVWYELSTTDPEAAAAFYTELVGWTTAAGSLQDAPNMPAYTEFQLGGESIGGIMETPAGVREAGIPPHWMGYITTDDLDATVEKVPSLGGQIHMPPHEIPTVGRFAVLADPQGGVFTAFESKTPVSQHPMKTGGFGWHELMTTDLDAALEFYSALFGWTCTQQMEGDDFRYVLFGFGEEDTIGGIGELPEGAPRPVWQYYINIDDLEASIDLLKSLGGKVVFGPMEVPGGGLIAQCADPQGAMFALHQPPRG